MLIRTLSRALNKAPVPYAAKTGNIFGNTRKARASINNMESYSNVSTLFAIVDRLANDTAAVEWKLYRKQTDNRRRYAWDDMDSRREVTEHAALTVLNKPNPHQTTQEFIELIQKFIDLTGEAFIAVKFIDNAKTIPNELWILPSTRVEINPHPDDFIGGYVYTAPDGTKIPFEPREIIHIKTPNPLDPFRGMSPVTPLLVDLDSHRFAGEYNRNFFKNDATPGGLLQYDDFLTPDQFNRISKRWNEQHRGVSNAGKFGMIEKGKWVNTSVSMRDMQFVELRRVSSEAIMEAFGFPKFKLGIVQDVNRASADASEVMYARSLLVPRLERIKQAFNAKFLALFGMTGESVEFDYCNPVPDDEETEEASLLNRVNIAIMLKNAGFDVPASLEIAGLPPIELTQGGAQNDMVRSNEQGDRQDGNPAV